MDDLFRSFFGIPRSKDFSGREDMSDWNNDRPGDSESFGSTFDVFMPRDIFKHMDEMFANMENMMKFGERQMFESYPSHPGIESDKEASPRDQMLKDGDLDGKGFFSLHRPYVGDSFDMDRRLQSSKDTDLDTVARNPKELERILERKKPMQDEQSSTAGSQDLIDRAGEEKKKQGGWRHWSSSFSSVTVRGADGTVEQKQTRTDTQGNTETRVSRRLEGGRQCEERTVTDPRGRVIESWSDCTKDMLLKQPPTKPDDDGADLSKLSSIFNSSSSSSDDNTVFKNIFGPDFPKSNC